MTEQAISVTDLHKSYGPVEAVCGIDLHVDTGEVFALLGPNGAGKTTTVEILEGHRKRTSGEVSVLGHDPERNARAFKDRIGIVLQETGVERYLTVEEVIELFRGYYPHPLPRDEIIEMVGLEEKRSSLVRRLSSGQHTTQQAVTWYLAVVEIARQWNIELNAGQVTEATHREAIIRLPAAEGKLRVAMERLQEAAKITLEE